MTVIMAWSECTIKIGKTPENETMAEAGALVEIAPIKDKSATLESSDGDELRMKQTGGKTIAREALEGGFMLKARLVEPTDELRTLLGLGAASGEEFQVKTHLINVPWSVEVTPKNIGATGIRAPKTNITYKPGWSEDDGHYADLEFEVLQGAAGYWYSTFKKKS